MPILQMRKLKPERRVAQLPHRWWTPVWTCWSLNGHWSQQSPSGWHSRAGIQSAVLVQGEKKPKECVHENKMFGVRKTRVCVLAVPLPG